MEKSIEVRVKKNKFDRESPPFFLIFYSKNN